MRTERVAICVCTYRRPEMLKRCLRSIAVQEAGPDLDVIVVVVNNDPETPRLGERLQLDEQIRLPVYWTDQPKRGIAAARNAALNAALKVGADWIAFIDDDEIAEPDWIAALMAPEYREVPILVGPVLTEYPEPLPFWISEKKRLKGAKGREGERMKTGATGNVRIAAALVLAGMRFDERLGLGGGEDNEFFTSAHQAGHEIRRTLRAMVTEPAHPERMSYWSQTHRAYWCAASELRRVAIRRGWAGALLRKAHTVPLNLLLGVLELSASPLFLLTGLDRFKRRALGGGKKIAKALGRTVALSGRIPQPYRVTVGH